MPKGVRYRILERQTEKGWQPFAIAYQRGSRHVLFCPAWRAPSPLDIGSLQDLDEHSFPSAGGFYRWADPQICRARVDHAADLFEYAVNNRAAETVKNRAAETAPLPAPDSRQFVPAFVHAISPESTLPLPKESFDPVPRRPPFQGLPLAWSVPYAREHRRAVISLEILDLCGPLRVVFPETASFLLDTGSPCTLVPRHALRSSFRERSGPTTEVRTPAGGVTIVEWYTAALSIPSRARELPPFSFGQITIGVVPSESWDSEHGLLGLDALDRVHVLWDTDEDNVFFLPREWVVNPPQPMSVR